jgi:biotin carboxylase
MPDRRIVKPKILIATTERWIPTTRLAVALSSAGFSIEAVCPSRHPLDKTGVVERMYNYSGLRGVASFATAITDAKSDLIVPGDDLATQHLHVLYAREQRNGSAGARICALIERSLGAPENFQYLYARSKFIEIAQEQGVRSPKTDVIADRSDLKKWLSQNGFPAVLKADRSSGGAGVRVVRTSQDAERAFRILQSPPVLARAVKRALIDQDLKLIRPALLRRRSTVNAQTFVEGREATSAVACWKGEVLAALHFEVLEKFHSTGPATVLRLISNAGMTTATEKMARRLNLSGLHGFDFMLEARTENAYLIEINPRSTQVGHLELGVGRDLPAALYAAASGEPIRTAPKVTENDTVALFPLEWIRDSASTYLETAYHDVPWDKPALIRACVRARRKEAAWYTQQGRLQAFSVIRLPQE